MANSIIDQLRRRNQLQSEAQQAQRQQEAFQGAFQDTPFTVGGQSYSTRYGEVPTPQEINWGGILGKAASNFMAARKGKEAREKSSEAEALNMQFMQSVLGEDPQAQKLFMAAQAGLPGADKALAEHIAPKKQSMAVLMQAITTGNLDPAMASEVAPQFGVDPNLAASAAQYALKQRNATEDRKHQRQIDLRMLGINAADDRLTRTLQTRNQGGGSRVSVGDGISEPNPNTGSYDLTPGQKQITAKETVRLLNDISKSTVQTGKYQNLRSRLEKSDAFGASQKVSKVLTEFQSPVLSAIGTAMRSKEVADLEDFVLNETLTRMAQLGGNDSNEELRRMQASLPSALNNKETALHLMDELQKWQEVNKEAAKMRVEDTRTGAVLQPGAEDDYYERAKQKLGWSGWKDISAKPEVEGKKQRRSFDSIFEEVTK